MLGGIYTGPRLSSIFFATNGERVGESKGEAGEKREKTIGYKDIEHI